MDDRTVRKVLDSLDEKELVEFTRQVARIPSVYGEEKAIGQAFADQMSKLNLETQIVESEKDRPNVLGWIRGTGGGESLTLNGHTDTTHSGGTDPMHTGRWTKDPYGGVLENGKIYGLGISNMKASDTAMLYAAAAIQRAGVRLRGDLLLALVVGECHGGVGTQDLMKKGFKTEHFVCSEPTDLNILTVHAYSQYFKVDIWGRSGHFGSHDHGCNAILVIYRLLDKLGPVHTEIQPGGWMRFEDKPDYHGLPRYHIATIRGALTERFLESWSNTPDFCSAVFNVRATPNKSIESTRDDIESVLQHLQEREPGFRYRVSIVRRMPGFEAPPQSKVVGAISRAYRTVVGREPNVGAIQPFMFMSSDSGHMQLAGMTDGVLMGPGKFTSSMQDEHVEVDKLITAAKIYALTALDVCGVFS